MRVAHISHMVRTVAVLRGVFVIHFCFWLMGDECVLVNILRGWSDLNKFLLMLKVSIL